MTESVLDVFTLGFKPGAVCMVWSGGLAFHFPRCFVVP